MDERPAAIAINIEVLTVEGLDGADAPQFQQDLGRELSRLVRERGLPPGALRPRPLIAVEGDLGRGAAVAGAEPLAARVADAIFRALRP